MIINKLRTLLFVFILSSIIFLPFMAKAQSYAAWYQNAQERIDTLRKNDYGIKIFDKNGQPFTGDVAVRMSKHEFPFGVAFDLNQGEASMGNSYSTNDAVQALTDAEIYRTERWSDYLAYAIPVETGKEYSITLKFAEIYHGADNARVFDVRVEGVLFLEGFDTHAMAGGKNIAVDTSLNLVATSNLLSIELEASIDNVAIKGIVVEEKNGESVLRINCGGPGLTTSDGNVYVAETGFFDPNVSIVASNDDWRKANMYKYFNAGVNENSFKWSGVQANPGPPNYTNFDNALAWTQKVGWDYRAHTLLWGGNDDHSTPGWVRNLPTVQDIIDTCKMRVIRDVTRYRGVIKEYDVVNEPLTNHADWLWNKIGDSIIGESYKWARSADPDAELYINDYNVEYNWGQAVEYRDLILRMLENGAPITGVGMQSHFWDGLRPNVDELVKNVNIIAETGLPIKFTEFDYGGDISQAQQAADYIKVLTIAFSHPSVVGMYHWSLRDGWSWRDGSGMFDAAGNPKLATDTLLYYTKTKWATNFETQINSTDPLVFNAYHGNYNIEAEFDGVVKVFNVPLLKANADSVFVLNEDDATLKGPQLLKTEIIEHDAINLLFDKAIDSNSIRQGDFKFFSPWEIGIESIEVNPDNENSLIMTLSSNLTIGNYISVSYFPGSLMANDGSIADAFGPENIPNQEDEPDPDPNSAQNLVENPLFKVYPNPATNNVNIVSGSESFTFNVYSSMGTLIYSGNSNEGSINLDVSSFNRGMYFIKLTNTNNEMNVQKFLLK